MIFRLVPRRKERLFFLPEYQSFPFFLNEHNMILLVFRFETKRNFDLFRGGKKGYFFDKKLRKTETLQKKTLSKTEKLRSHPNFSKENLRARDYQVIPIFSKETLDLESIIRGKILIFHKSSQFQQRKPKTSRLQNHPNF